MEKIIKTMNNKKKNFPIIATVVSLSLFNCINCRVNSATLKQVEQNPLLEESILPIGLGLSEEQLFLNLISPEITIGSQINNDYLIQPRLSGYDFVEIQRESLLQESLLQESLLPIDIGLNSGLQIENYGSNIRILSGNDFDNRRTIIGEDLSGIRGNIILGLEDTLPITVGFDDDETSLTLGSLLDSFSQLRVEGFDNVVLGTDVPILSQTGLEDIFEGVYSFEITGTPRLRTEYNGIVDFNPPRTPRTDLSDQNISAIRPRNTIPLPENLRGENGSGISGNPNFANQSTPLDNTNLISLEQLLNSNSLESSNTNTSREIQNISRNLFREQGSFVNPILNSSNISLQGLSPEVQEQILEPDLNNSNLRIRVTGVVANQTGGNPNQINDFQDTSNQFSEVESNSDSLMNKQLRSIINSNSPTAVTTRFQSPLDEQINDNYQREQEKEERRAEQIRERIKQRIEREQERLTRQQERQQERLAREQERQQERLTRQQERQQERLARQQERNLVRTRRLPQNNPRVNLTRIN